MGTPLKTTLKELPIFGAISNPSIFFELLPSDWLAVLLPHLDTQSTAIKAYGLFEKNQLVVGGLIFSELLDNSSNFEQGEAAHLFKKIGPYIGFVWVIPERRGAKLGSLWFQELFKIFPNNGFWLSIEEEGLKTFYEKIGFKVFKTQKEKGQFIEQILTFQP